MRSMWPLRRMLRNNDPVSVQARRDARVACDSARASGRCADGQRLSPRPVTPARPGVDLRQPTKVRFLMNIGQFLSETVRSRPPSGPLSRPAFPASRSLTRPISPSPRHPGPSARHPRPVAPLPAAGAGLRQPAKVRFLTNIGQFLSETVRSRPPSGPLSRLAPALRPAVAARGQRQPSGTATRRRPPPAPPAVPPENTPPSPTGTRAARRCHSPACDALGESRPGRRPRRR
ncbi:hypothetical protein FIV07_11100 [Mycobacterium sp. THAF192]|nr:hypothetical protein FIV07_11100 [Mycobacterium sp. THAF192]